MSTDDLSHAQALADSLTAAKIAPTDTAGAMLAARYAELLDVHLGNPDVYKELGPRYLATLTALGLTKAGRSVAEGGKTTSDHAAIAKRDELRERRARRTAG